MSNLQLQKSVFFSFNKDWTQQNITSRHLIPQYLLYWPPRMVAHVVFVVTDWIITYGPSGYFVSSVFGSVQ